jgi:hypothetical protein
MKRFVSATALMFVVAGCKAGSGRNAADTAAGSAPAAAPAPSGTMQPDTARGSVAQPMSPSSSVPRADSMSRTRDTAMDTTRTAGAASAKNQTQSGVTNAKTGKSTLGPGIKKTDPTQGQAVTSKGDTLVRRKKP